MTAAILRLNMTSSMPETYALTNISPSDSLLRLGMMADRLMRATIERLSQRRFTLTAAGVGSVALGADYLLSKHGSGGGVANSIFCNIPLSSQPSAHDGYLQAGGMVAEQVTHLFHLVHCGPLLCEAAFSNTAQPLSVKSE